VSSRNAEVVVTGAGAVSAIGIGCGPLLSSLDEGRDGIRPITRFSTHPFSVNLGATVPDDWLRGLSPQYSSDSDLCFDFARIALTEALWQAGLEGDGRDQFKTALVVGTSLGDLKNQHHRLASRLAGHFGFKGPAITISTACSSSNNAIGLARDLLDGFADVVVAGGADVLSLEAFAGFHALGVLSPAKCAPFSRPAGTTLGEGAGFLVLERAADAACRGAPPLAAVSGYGLSADAFHETSPDPSGGGVARAIQMAILDAGLAPGEIGYVNAHGSGTANNDAVEWLALQRVFGAGAGGIPVSSSKGHLGHCQGAAGVLEALCVLLLMPRQSVPPTLHHRGVRPRCPEDPVASDRPRPHPYRHAACLNSGFGGANAALILSTSSSPRPVRAARPVEIMGLGAVAGHGLNLSELGKAIEDPEFDQPMPAYEIDRVIPNVDPRGLDPATRHLIAAAALALGDAGIAVRGPLKERAGLVIGTTRLSSQSAGEFYRSIAERGPGSCSPLAFARITLNAPAGSCSKALMLKGPTSTLTSGPGSGLGAVLYAATMIANWESVDLVLAAGVDEADSSAGGLTEGAGCIALAPAGKFPVPPGRERAVLAGFGIAGPEDLSAALGQAFAMAGILPDSVDLIFGSADDKSVLEHFFGRPSQKLPRLSCRKLCRGDEAATSALDFIAAALVIRSGESRAALVVGGGRPCATYAAILTGWRS